MQRLRLVMSVDTKTSDDVIGLYDASSLPGQYDEVVFPNFIFWLTTFIFNLHTS